MKHLLNVFFANFIRQIKNKQVQIDYVFINPTTTKYLKFE